MAHTAYIGIGSNLGDRLGNCLLALRMFSEHDSIEVRKVSRWYETEAWGDGGPADDPSYLNAAAELDTSLSAQELLAELLDVERRLGRPHPRPKGLPRAIDLDLLLYDELKLNLPGLTLPHPQLSKRLFVLLPLCDIGPALVHPTLGLTIRDLAVRRQSAPAGRVKALAGPDAIG